MIRFRLFLAGKGRVSLRGTEPRHRLTRGRGGGCSQEVQVPANDEVEGPHVAARLEPRVHAGFPHSRRHYWLLRTLQRLLARGPKFLAEDAAKDGLKRLVLPLHVLAKCGIYQSLIVTPTRSVNLRLEPFEKVVVQANRDASFPGGDRNDCAAFCLCTQASSGAWRFSKPGANDELERRGTCVCYAP